MSHILHKFIDSLSCIAGAINSFIWGTPMLVLFVVVGIIMTLGTRFFQLAHIRHWLKCTVGSLFSSSRSSLTCSDSHELSQFQALCTALASTIGTGNIAGVSAAVAMGGPGAVMWMWVSALFGMMTAYAENVLGIYYRHKNSDGEWCGGPMYYITNGMSSKPHLGKLAPALAFLFCVFCIFASFGMGNMAQVNSISTALKANFGISPLACGIILAVLVAFIIVGGVGRAGRTAEKLVPFMAMFYIVGALAIFIMNYKQIPYVFSSIFRSAFSMRSVAGATAGLIFKHTVVIGFKRGVFSNEAGLGSAVMAHSSANVKEPAIQGMWGIFVVFFDTIVVCTLTAFVLLSTSCPAMTLSEALQGIGKEPRYICLKEDSMIDTEHIELVDSNFTTVYAPATNDTQTARVYKVTPTGGIPFDVCIKKEPYSDSARTYTNIMSVRGISVDSGGNTIDDTAAPINAVALEKLEGVPLVTFAFSQKIGDWAGKLIAASILLFAFSTIVGWSLYGSRAWEFIFSSSSLVIYKILFVLCIILGAILNLSVVWNISDAFNGLMAVPNLIALVSLSPVVFKITKNYTERTFSSSKQKPMPSFRMKIHNKKQ